MSILKSALVAGVVALGALTTTAATTTTAAAKDVRFGVQIGGPGYSVGFGNFRGDRWDRGQRKARKHRRCRPGKALRKARNNGVRRARIIRSNRRGLVVAGRQWGDRVVIGFGRHRSCPVRFVRAR